jgi:predicted cobalt transporter CbtA
MHDATQRRLAFHGAAVILLGLLAGFPYAMVVTGDLAGSERAWRMAHMEGVTNGLLIFAVAALLPALGLGDRGRRALVACVLFTAYANTVAAVIGASTGHRGLAFGDGAANTLVFLLFTAAIVTIFAVVGLMLQGGRRGAD